MASSDPHAIREFHAYDFSFIDEYALDFMRFSNLNIKHKELEANLELRRSHIDTFMKYSLTDRDMRNGLRTVLQDSSNKFIELVNSLK